MFLSGQFRLVSVTGVSVRPDQEVAWGSGQGEEAKAEREFAQRLVVPGMRATGRLNPSGTVKLHNKPGRKGVLPCPGAGLKVAPPQSSASRSPVAPKKRAQVTLQPPDPYAGANRTPDSKTIPSQVGDRAEAKNQALPTGPKT